MADLIVRARGKGKAIEADMPHEHGQFTDNFENGQFDMKSKYLRNMVRPRGRF